MGTSSAEQHALLLGSWVNEDVVETDEEVANIAAAIAASLSTASGSAVPLVVGAAASTGAAVEAGAELSLAGMRTEADEHNCLINVVIRCLWRCAEFRQQVGCVCRTMEAAGTGEHRARCMLCIGGLIKFGGQPAVLIKLPLDSALRCR